MIAAYAHNGHCSSAIELFRLMNLDGTNAASEFLFVSLLGACSHKGTIEEGWGIFREMVGDFGVVAIKEHYCAMIDVLGRAGKLREAEELAETMPFLADEAAWGSLLAACKAVESEYGVEVARRAAAKVMELSTEKASPYLALASVY
ncbi:hypothetical protein SELMODRAFT_117748, partial [Selaginella moellendorffii]